MQAQSLPALLRSNVYPGRGIVLGSSPSGQEAVAAYFIMGRSTNSRNRVFAPTEDGIRTQAHDPALMTDPSLVIYHPVRQAGDCLIVTNGDQTDTVRDAFASGEAPRDPGEAFRRFAAALETRTFEPDPPHYTPRISGVLTRQGGFALSILKSAEGNPDCCLRFLFTYDCPPAGEGRFLHTYAGDGSPLPSFPGEPVRVAVETEDPRSLAREIWDALNPDNRVSLFVRYWNRESGQTRDALINRYGDEA